MRTILTLTFFLSCLFSYAQGGSWDIFYPSMPAVAVAAHANTILVGTNGAGLTVFDTLGNRQSFFVANSGIPSNDIRKTAIDATGHWWVEYYLGFARFDGTAWQVWSKTDAGISSSETVSVLKAAPDGSIYAGTSAGFLHFKNDVWTLFTTANSGLPSNSIRDLTFDAVGNIYFATGAGLAITDGTNWTIHDAASTGLTNLNNVKSVAVTADGIVWVTVGQNRFAKLESGTWTEYVAADIGLTGAGFSGAVFYDAFDRLWLNFTKKISVLSNGVWTHYDETAIGCTFLTSAQNNIFLATDGAGNLWATTCGLTRFDGLNWEQQPTTNSGLPGGLVFAISEDAGGNIWFGTLDGIGKLDPTGNWSNFDPADFGATSVYNDVYDILSPSNGDVWIGLVEGEMLRLDGTGWTLFDTCATAFPDWSQLQLNLYIRASAEAPNGDLWFSVAPTAGFGARLARYSATNGWSFFDPSNSPVVNGADVEAIAFDASGTGWFASTNKGLYHFDGTAWTVFNAANSDLPDDHVHDVTISPDGAVWACTELGLARLDGSDWTILNTSNSDLPSNETYRIAFDGIGGMYVGYDIPGAGAQVAELRNGQWQVIAAPGFEDLVVDPPYAFMVDSHNRLWFTKVYYDQNLSLRPVFRYDPMLTATDEGVDEGFPITAFPNPTAGNVFLQWPTGMSGEALLQVRNAQGQVVQAASLFVSAGQSVPVNLSGLPTGSYWITVYQGSRFSTIKMVKQ